MDFYTEYKPFRNFIRRFNRTRSLIDIWHLSLHLTERHALLPDYFADKPKLLKPLHEYLFPWDLGILAKEIVLNASETGELSFKQWRELADAVNHLRRLDDFISAELGYPESDILLEIHRIGQRQFPFQTKPDVNSIVRAVKIFGAPEVDRIAVRDLGLTARQAIRLGAATAGHFLKKPFMSLNKDYERAGIPNPAAIAYLRRITSTLPQLKRELEESRSFGRDWFHTWNPLEARPLISIDPNQPDVVICPIPQFVLRRMSGGMFYDLVKSEGFSNPFGDAFQNYVGEVIRKTCCSDRFGLIAEEPYYVGDDKNHGVDWILSDGTAHLFIECKAKRLTFGAKLLSNMDALNNDIDAMADAIVQNYKNIRHAQRGYSTWEPDALPIFPMVLTLEDWFIFSHRVHEILLDRVRCLLVAAGLPESTLQDMPYTIASVRDFEIASQIISRTGIAPLLSRKVDGTHRPWSLIPYFDNYFSDELRRASKGIFVAEFAEFMLAISDPPQITD